MSRATVTVGCHRSGTSLVANILHKNGVVMGEDQNFRPKPNSSNEKGFYENYLFRRINDNILQEKGHDVKSWDTQVPVVTHTSNDLYNQMNRLVVHYNRTYKEWGFKDPRTCLTLPVWKKVLPADTRFVFVYRHPVEVAKSLQARGNVQTIEDGLKIWGTYNLRAYVELQGTDVVFVHYNELLETGEIGKTGIFGHSIIEKTLQHHNDLDVPREYLKLWWAISSGGKDNVRWR